MAAVRSHTRLPLVALLLGAVLLAQWGLPGTGFVAPRQAGVGRTSTVPRGAKSLFDRTKDLNEKLQEANSDNELLIDTDAFWSIGYLLAGALATYGFVALLQSFKPEA